MLKLLGIVLVSVFEKGRVRISHAFFRVVRIPVVVQIVTQVFFHELDLLISEHASVAAQVVPRVSLELVDTCC